MTKTSSTVFTFLLGAAAGAVAGAFLSMDKIKAKGNELLNSKKSAKSKQNDNEDDYFQGV
jgi:hypothetical protein